MKYLRFVIVLVMICGPLLSDAQVRKYFSLGAGLNQSTYYLQTGLFQEGEFKVLYDGPLFIGPQFNGQFNIDLNKHHTLATSVNVVVYSRVIALAIPINLSYYYNFLSSKNSPFIKLDAGYSFFLTSGALYGVGLGYRYGKFRGSVNYTNQLKGESILENNEFITGRLSSMSLNLEYLIRRKTKGGKTYKARKKK
ncbi:MAG: hypothetical protein AAFQ94_17575 [Bacteroidota bacterium]